MFWLSQFWKVGNYAERKWLLTQISKLSTEQGDDRQLSRTLRHLSDVHFFVGLYEQGIQQAKETSEISERLGDMVEQARCLIELARLRCDGQLDAAEKAASHAINLFIEEDEQYLVCKYHRLH